MRHWIDWLRGDLGAAAARLVISHPASPLERANFLPMGNRPPGSCDRRLLEARRLLDAARLRSWLPLASQPLPLETPELPGASAANQSAADNDPEAAFNALQHWLIAPQAQWLEQLGLKPREWAQLLEDFDRTSLDERQRSQLLGEALGSEGHNDPQTWLEQHRGQGLLPPGAAGSLEARTLVPTVAVVTEDGRPGVLKVGRDNQPTFSPVSLGASSGRDTQILEGLRPGERIFIDLPPWAKKKRGD